MTRIEKRTTAAVEFAKQGDLGGSYNDRYDGFMAGSRWERDNPIGVLDEDYAWAIYNFINGSPEAIDVYMGKTTLEITYKDSIPMDSVVVFKTKTK